MHALMTPLRSHSQSAAGWPDQHAQASNALLRTGPRISKTKPGWEIVVIWQRNRIRDLIETASWRVAESGNDVVRLVRYLRQVERDSPR
jgi:hypothetical protein